ncbi:zinc knuckle protein [Penaeus vannamei]|uniref:Zinc knuckle protein n=1 Tax=Penaeus vannamei TaxID=6689 RepID=A0A423T566_PENVA|nr:zinc knuckle protein [Penaeus vannamei]
MMAGQAPLDFHTTLEGMVYQGYRDHREAVGNPEELIRRVFLQGLPGWLRELLALKEGDSVQSLVETAQRLWNARVGIRNDDEPPKLPAAPRRGEISEVSRIPPRPIRRRDQHSALVCWGCRREGHFRRECPFRTSRMERLQPSLDIGGAKTGFTSDGHMSMPVGKPPSIEAAVQTVTSSDDIAAQGPCGRPLVKIRVHGIPMTAFIDTGSEVTLLKMERTKSITPKRIYHQARGLRGVSGRLFEATSEWDVKISLGDGRKTRQCHHRVCVVEGVDFPGEILIDGVASVWVVNGGTRPVCLQNGTHVATGQLCTVMEFEHLSQEPSLVGQTQEKEVAEDSSEPKPDDKDDVPDPEFSFDEEDDFDFAYERQCHINDIKPFRVLGEVTYPDLYDEYGPDYVDPLLDEEAEPGVMLLACLQTTLRLCIELYTMSFWFLRNVLSRLGHFPSEEEDEDLLDSG